MFREDYKAAFSNVTASGETRRKVLELPGEDYTKITWVRKFAVVAAVVIMVSAMTVTVFASEELASWFQRFFSENMQENLTEEQIGYIVENEQILNQSHTQSGYSLKLKSAITDGAVAYITIGITAPENVVLSKTVIEGYRSEKPAISFGNDGFLTLADGSRFYGGYWCRSMEDYDGLDHTQDLFITLEPDAENGMPLPGSEWKIHIEDLIATYTNQAYIDARKAEGIDDTDGTRSYPQVVLAEGVWDFEFQLDGSNANEVELISQPVITTALGNGWRVDGTAVYEDVTITSFLLRSLSASIYLDGDETVDFTYYDQCPIRVVMKDGSEVQLRTSAGQPGEAKLLADTPIVLENAEYVLLADGTKLMMPQNVSK